MQAWVRTHEGLRGFSDWMKTPTAIPDFSEDGLIEPRTLRLDAPDVLLAIITGDAVEECSE